MKFSIKDILKPKRSSSMLGLDIGTTSIKLAEVSLRGDMAKLINYGILESKGAIGRANTAFHTSGMKLYEEEAGEMLKLLVDRMKVKSKQVTASLPAFAAFVTILNLPEMSPADLKKAVVFQAEQYVPIPMSEIALDWAKVGEYEDEKGFKHIQILLISVPREQIEKYRILCKKAGLSLGSLEIESLSIVRMLIGSDPTPTFIVDIGSRSTSIVVAAEGRLRMVAQTDFAGSSLSQALAAGLDIDPFRAEEMKKERGIVATGPNRELSTIMLPFLDAIISEVKRADFSYHNQFPNGAKIERIILSGGGANLLGIEEYFEKQVGLPTVKASPLSRFEYNSSLEPLVPELNPLLAVSLGLSLRDEPTS